MMKLVLVVLLTLTPQIAKSDVLNLDEVYINYKSFVGETRTPYLEVPGLEGHSLQNELNLNINMTLVDHFYWNNTIHSLNDGEYRLIGWNYRIGVHITDYVDFGWYHFSEHYADFTNSYGFPLQNAWELNLYLYRNKPTGKGFF